MYRRFLVIVFCLVLAACSEPPADKPVTAAFGEPVNYLQHQQIQFPGFNLRYLGERDAPKAAQLAYSDQGHTFEVATTTEKSFVTWMDFDNTKRTELFRVGDKEYFLRLRSSDLQNRELEAGELVVWTVEQHRQHAPPRLSVASSEKRQVLTDLYLAYRQSLEKGDWNQAKTFLDNNRIENLELLKARANMNEGAIVQSLIKTAPKSEMISAQDAGFSPMEAQLYLKGKIGAESKIIGVAFVKEAGNWKIAGETVMPDDAAGKRWVSLFLRRE